MHPKVIVLILSYNGKNLLDDSVASYLANDYPNLKMVVIDNGSTDGTHEYVIEKWPGVFVLRTEKNLGYSGGFNLGLDYAFNHQQADYVLISNNDVKADPKTIAQLINVAETDPMIGFVIGKVYYYDHPETFQTVGKKYDPILFNAGHIGSGEKDNGQYENIEERAWCDDIYWLVRKQVYQQTGGYDTEFAFQAEDFEWQVRAKKAGFKIYYTPYAKIWHKDSMTIGKSSPFKTYYDARNPLIVHFKHRTPEQVKVFLRYKLKGNIKYTFKSMLRMKFIHCFKLWQGFISALVWASKNNKLSIKNFW
jgi:GT2 family glycosyltransferase